MTENLQVQRGLTAHDFACVLRIVGQMRHWQNNETLFRHGMEVTEGNYGACYNLGVIVAQPGKQDEAMRCYLETLRFKPDYARAHNSLAIIFAQPGRFADAVDHFQLALQHEPKLVEAHANLGRAGAAGEVGLGVTNGNNFK